MKKNLLARRRRYGMEAHIADGRQRHFSRGTGVWRRRHFWVLCFVFFRSTAFPLLPSSRTKDALGVFLRARVCGEWTCIFWLCVWHRFAWEFSAPGHGCAHSCGFRFILARVGPHRSTNTA